MKTWRDRIAPMIAEIAAEVGTKDEKKFRKTCRERYPFERRRGWVYVVWLDEIRIQLGKSKFPKTHTKKQPKEQLSLFDETENPDNPK